MRRSTTSGVTDTARAADRRRLGAVLGAELICAVLLVGGSQTVPAGPADAAPSVAANPSPSAVAPSAAARTVTTPDGRITQLIDLGAPGGAALLDRIGAQLPGATAAVTAFWGENWPRELDIVVAGSPQQFATLAGGGTDVAATTTVDRIMFSPAAAAMTDADLRIVLRHELFHYAARSETAADAPVWLTEGVADFVGRPAAAVPPPVVPELPTDAELATAGPARSAAYDRAWSFASYVADTYGADRLRTLYVEACGPGHADIATAVREALGAELSAVLRGWRQWRDS
ncbi:Uncharacterised protein [Mycolicibacterium vanbaalenii]|uniref:Peptidase n=1 Tax=Mycolicibacterium vanbaalenii TaxID=110539 RepID=A0A5S9R7L9_MYCVN|nr:peptidase [Mycolicibacterium vanbaalenii]CAA0131353.1 Uncharacterised protein [Mycolicibacterium vanbaalenii]